MGERNGIDDALLAAVEQTRAKLRRAARTARGEDHESSGHSRHGDRGSSAMGSHGVDRRRDEEPAS